ncbi:MAG TPA: HAD-IIB family hydrolase [Symbiobacteriaceae bacterium]|nr:HAD-IIB family hydrolase [Symbiobacteriaceae bacterium]
MEYRLIALDLDGTLLGGRHEISPRTRVALSRARERGIVLAVATGRSPQSACHFSRLIGGGPVICCNGGGVLDAQGEYLSLKPIPPALLRRSLQICEESRLLLECYTPAGIVLDRPASHMGAYLRWVRPGMSLPRALGCVAGIWRTNRVASVRSLVKWSERPDHPPVLKLMAVGGPETLARAAGRLQREAPGLEVTSSGAENLELTAAGVSKGYGLQMLCARLQIPRQAILAFGDSDNDLQMLSYAGTGVAMGGAPAAVKAAAARVAPSADEDGVASVIEELCLR